QLRDRRTMFVMVVLPLLIYPLGGVALMQITLGSVPGPSVVGVAGADSLPPGDAASPFPPLLLREDGRAEFSNLDPALLKVLNVVLLDGPDRAPLDEGRVDLILIVPPDFRSLLEAGQAPVLTVLSRPDDRSRLAVQRTRVVLDF